MIAWKIKFEDGADGYQVMTDDRFLIGLFKADGTPFPHPGDYQTVDVGSSPLVGVPLPDWAANLNA